MRPRDVYGQYSLMNLLMSQTREVFQIDSYHFTLTV